MKQTVCVIGEGAWGTAFASLLAHNGHQVNLWCHDQARAELIEQNEMNIRYLPGVKLSGNIKPLTDFAQALHGVTWVFEAIPMKFLRETLILAKPYVSEQQKWVVLSKGIETETFFVPSQIISDVVGIPLMTMVVAGPNFAMEVAQKKITASTIAAPNCALGKELYALLANDYFHPYVSLDVIGTQVGGALKNVIALAVGLIDGAGYGDNAKAFVLTRGFHEMVSVACALGGKQETLYGLSGVGDLVLTAMGKASRNREAGYQLGKGAKLADITITAEGIASVKSVYQFAQSHALDIPLCVGLYKVLFEGESVQNWLTVLMQRSLEFEDACPVR